MGKRLWSFLTICAFTVSMAFAQQKVTGTVIEAETGEPVIGASVKVKEAANIGAATNIEGKFTLDVPANAKTLIVSYIGLKQKEVAIKPNLRIVLESEVTALKEQVVVAFGTSTKEAFTGSATVIKTEDIAKHTTSNVINTLAGNVPGLSLRGASGLAGSGDAKIHIRGIASMYANTDPLIIVDGAPYDASINNINPDDVESISVLKDASSAALYGARGAAGVIIITTKRGKTNEAVINVNAKWGANSRAVQDYDKITDPGQYYEAAYQNYYNYAFYGNGMSVEDANKWANKNMLTHLGYNIYTVPDGEQLIGLDGKLNPNAKMGYVQDYNGEKYYYQADDWTKAAYHVAFRQEYDVNISAANERTNFFASAGYLDEDGIIDNSSFKRFNSRIKVDYNARPWLKVGINASWIHTKTESNPNNNGDLGSTNLRYYTSNIAPIYPIYVRVLDENGNPVIRTDENGNPQYDYGRAGKDYPENRAFLQTGNPLGSNHYNNVWRAGNQLNATGFVEVKFTDWLKFTATSNINWGHSNESDYENMLYGPKVGVRGQIDKTQTDTYRQNHNQLLNFSKQFDDHNVGVTLGHEWYRTKTTYLSAAAQGLFNPIVQEINAAANNKYSSNSYTDNYNVEGYFLNALYNYQEKYFFQGAIRRDATSHFDPDNRWGNFWSLGAGWLINKETFFKNLNAEWIDMLKVKASIGQKGNDAIGVFRYINTYTLTASGTYTMFPSLRNHGEKGVTWETTTASNFGVEFNLFNNRLTGSVEYYYNKVTDLLFWLSTPESIGYRGYYGNAGDKRQTGVELALVGTPIRTNKISLDLNFNISTNSEKILKLPESKKGKIGGFAETNNNIQMWYEEGKPMYNAFLYEYAGVNENGEALYWYDKNLSPAGGADQNYTDRPGKEHSGTTTKIGEASRYAQGSILPKAFGGFGANLKVYDFDLSAMFDFQLGGKVYDYSYMSLMGNIVDAGDAGSAIHKDALKAWTPNNTSSDIPRMQYQDKYTSYSSNRWLTNASYLNFQSITVGYTLPAVYAKSIGLSKLRIYFSGENLCFWSARKGLDPRYDFEGNDYLPGYSPVRSVVGGIQVSF